MARVREIIESNKIKTVRFQWLSVDLILRSMVTHVDSLEESVANGIGINKAVACLNALSQLVPGSPFGPESGEWRIVPDLRTFAPIPHAQGSARFLSELCDTDLRPYEGDTRYFLRRVIRRVEELGYSARVACESEFYLLRRSGGQLVPYGGMDRNEGFVEDEGLDSTNEYLQELIRELEMMNVQVERIKKEAATSQIEVIIRHAEPLKAADDFVTLRHVARGLAGKMGLAATFLPKPFQGLAGNGLHVHLSLQDAKSGKNLFNDSSDRRGLNLSELGYHFVAGILAHMRGLTAIASPLPNSYKRLIPSYSWAPTTLTYGGDNRSVALRVPSMPKNAHASRVEFRVADPTANPYLLIGALMLAGLDGVERGLDPGEPISFDVLKLSEEALSKQSIERLPRTMEEAVSEFRRDGFLRHAIGETLTDLYCKARESESQIHRTIVTPWEVNSFIASF